MISYIKHLNMQDLQDYKPVSANNDIVAIVKNSTRVSALAEIIELRKAKDGSDATIIVVQTLSKQSRYQIMQFRIVQSRDFHDNVVDIYTGDSCKIYYLNA